MESLRHPSDHRSGLQLRRTMWHAVGLLVAAVAAWLILQGYRQPELLLELANMRLC